jgi:hypothetical protein
LAVDNYQFVASLVSSVAWPTAVVFVAVVFRGPIGEMIGRLEHVKSPLFEGWAKAAEETREALAVGPKPDETPVSGGPLLVELAGVAVTSPREAVLRAAFAVETLLRETLVQSGIPKARVLMLEQMIEAALQAGVISQPTATAVRGLANLRNVALQGSPEDLDYAKAIDFLALADAVEYALETEAKQRKPVRS